VQILYNQEYLDYGCIIRIILVDSRVISLLLEDIKYLVIYIDAAFSM